MKSSCYVVPVQNVLINISNIASHWKKKRYKINLKANIYQNMPDLGLLLLGYFQRSDMTDTEESTVIHKDHMATGAASLNVK